MRTDARGARGFSRAISATSAVIVVASVACGKKGPPLPPLVKLPVAPASFVAERRGNHVDLQFVVPAANTDNTRPANIAHVDVYAITTRTPITEDDVVKQGTRVATLNVKAPRDPNQTIEEDEPPADMEPPEGEGLDQGAVARVAETLEQSALVPVEPKQKSRAQEKPAAEPIGPLLPPRPETAMRRYVAVGLSANDKKGRYSTRLDVPLVPPPPPPETPEVTYDETAITVKWPAIGGVSVQDPAADGVLPSRPIGPARPAIHYNVYSAPAAGVPVKLTQTPVADAEFTDKRIVWGEERCYTVRAVETVAGAAIESEAPPAKCTPLTDKFPPAAPVNLQSSPAEGAIDLIWDANTEKDLAGYILLRGQSAESLEPLMSEPIRETTFRDRVQLGIRFFYAVKAVDTAGNASPASKTVEEAAR